MVYWVPVFGYLLLLRRAKHQALVHQASLPFIQFSLCFALVVVSYFLLLRWPLLWGMSFLVLAACALVALLFIMTPWEANYVSTKRPTGGGWHLVRWDTMHDLPEQEIRHQFSFINYHEIMFSLVGIVIGVALRFLR